jgi:molybdopterin-guanine dinucleotide biosynthesis protein A
MRRVVDDVVIAGPEDLVPGVRCVADPAGATPGPLAALAAAMDLAGADDVLVLVAVDQPLVRAVTLGHLLDLSDGSMAVVPIAGDKRQVTCATYPARWAGEARGEATRQGGSLQSLLARLPCRDVLETEWRLWGEDGRSWFSVDTPQLLAEAEGMIAAT